MLYMRGMKWFGTGCHVFVSQRSNVQLVLLVSPPALSLCWILQEDCFLLHLAQSVFTYCVCCDWIWPEVDEREVLFACQGNVDNLAARSLWNSWEGLFNLKFAPGCNMILKKSNMPMRMHRSAQVSGGSIIFLKKKLVI